MELQFYPDPARKLSANPYDIYHCCVYSEKLLMMDRHVEFLSKNKFEKLVHLVGFIIKHMQFLVMSLRTNQNKINTILYTHV